MFGLSKLFVGVLIFAVAVGYGTKTPSNTITIIAVYAVGISVWRILTSNRI